MVIIPFILKLNSLTWAYISGLVGVGISPTYMTSIVGIVFTGLITLLYLLLDILSSTFEVIPSLLLVAVIKTTSKPKIDLKKYYNFFICWLFLKFWHSQERNLNTIILLVFLRVIYLFCIICLQIGATGGEYGSSIFSIYDISCYIEDPFLFTNLFSSNAANNHGLILMNNFGGNSGGNMGGPSGPSGGPPGGPPGSEGIDAAFGCDNRPERPRIVMRLSLKQAIEDKLHRVTRNTIYSLAEGVYDDLRYKIQNFTENNWEFVYGALREEFGSREELYDYYVLDNVVNQVRIRLIYAEGAIHMKHSIEPSSGLIDLWDSNRDRGTIFNNTLIEDRRIYVRGKWYDYICYGEMYRPVQPANFFYIQDDNNNYVEYNPRLVYKQIGGIFHHEGRWLYIQLAKPIDSEGNSEPQYIPLGIKTPSLDHATNGWFKPVGKANNLYITNSRTDILTKVYIANKYNTSLFRN